MILDKNLQFSDAQALTATAVSTNVIDLTDDRDMGIGEPMAIVVTVGVAADYTTTDETYQVQLQSGSTATPTTVIAQTGTINGDDLPLGKKVVLPIGFENERYLRLNYVLAGTTPSVTVDAYLQPLRMVDGDVIYANGYDIT